MPKTVKYIMMISDLNQNDFSFPYYWNIISIILLRLYYRNTQLNGFMYNGDMWLILGEILFWNLVWKWSDQS